MFKSNGGLANKKGLLSMAGTLMRRILRRDGPNCAYCNRETTLDKDAPLERTKDHVLPKARGGTNALTNLVVACRECNELKGNLTASEFFAAYPALKGAGPVASMASSQITMRIKSLVASGMTLDKTLAIVSHDLEATLDHASTLKVNNAEESMRCLDAARDLHTTNARTIRNKDKAILHYAEKLTATEKELAKALEPKPWIKKIKQTITYIFTENDNGLEPSNRNN